MPPRTDRDRNRGYRCRGLRFFLTYPQCPHSASGALGNKCENLGCTKYIVARELHEDGSHHLHAYLEFESEQVYCGSDWADFIDDDGTSRHGSYEAVRSARAAAAYVAKDGEYDSAGFSTGEIADILRKAKRHHSVGAQATIGAALLEGQAIEAIVSDYPQLMVSRNLDMIKSNVKLVMAYRNPLKGRVCTELDLWGQHKWEFDPNIPLRSSIKARMPLLYGERQIGKSTCIRSAPWRAYFIREPRNWVDFIEADYDLIVLDEATPKRCQELGYSTINDLCDGFGALVNIKHGAARVGKRLPFVIISNFSPESLFPGLDEGAAAVLSRFTWFECRRPNIPVGAPWQPPVVTVVENPFIR